MTRLTSDRDSSADLRGLSRLTVDAVAGVTDLVEAMHRNVASPLALAGTSAQGRTRGVTGLVYRSVRGVTRLVGCGLDAALAQLAPLLGGTGSSPRREAVLAALNGVLGDHLAGTGNPLTITMRLRKDGRPLSLDQAALAAAFPSPGGKLLVMVHGLSMNDLEWNRQAHDHGAALARDLGYTRVYLHYNTGRHISTNGREFADTLEQLLREWPVPVEELVVIGHSMGGLVARSACHYAKRAGHGWLRHLDKLVFLGTPHHGAPLERLGNWVDLLVGISPYTAPFARLGRVRSAGIKDLRHGNLLDEDWEGRDSGSPRDSRNPLPLPKGVRCYAIAATKKGRDSGRSDRLPGDGLVPVASALGRHPLAAFDLRIPDSRRWIGYGMNHLDLLSRRDVCERMKDWLAGE